MKLNALTLLAVSSVLAAGAFAQTPAPSAGAPSRLAPAMVQQQAQMMAKTSMFKGIEVNKGTVSLSRMGGKNRLTLSADFEIPKSPAPHWQVVDSKGNTYLLNQLRIAGDKTNREITLPSYIRDVKSVQIWCSFAEVVLGEASFAKAQTLKQG